VREPDSRDVRLEFVVLNQELRVAVTELVAELLEGELQSIALLLTDDRRRSRRVVMRPIFAAGRSRNTAVVNQ
jgi:hypothetical protein